MTRSLYLAVLFIALLTFVSCKKQSTALGMQNQSKPTVELSLGGGDELPTVVFNLKSSNDPQVGLWAYDCTSVARGRTAKFRLVFRQEGSSSGDIPVAWGNGKFVAVAGSDNVSLIEDLKTTLEAKRTPIGSARIAELPFDTAVLGERQSRSSSGGLSSNPPGNWTAIKIFLPKGGDDGEVFLNVNPVLGKGEFAIKDSDYGDYLVEQFAKVL